MSTRVPVEKKVLNENQILANELRERFRENGVFCLNLISSPGSGKTTLSREDAGAAPTRYSSCRTHGRHSDRERCQSS